MLTRLARRLLADELRAYEDDLRFQADTLRRQDQTLAAQRAAHAELRAELDAAQLALEGVTQTRLEQFFAQRWAELSTALDAAPADESTCRRVPLHSPNEVARYVAQLQRETGYPNALEGYRCAICPRHPLVGRVRHVRHVESQPERRPFVGRASLTQPLAPELVAHVRAHVAAQTTDELRRLP